MPETVGVLHFVLEPNDGIANNGVSVIVVELNALRSFVERGDGFVAVHLFS